MEQELAEQIDEMISDREAIWNMAFRKSINEMLNEGKLKITHGTYEENIDNMVKACWVEHTRRN